MRQRNEVPLLYIMLYCICVRYFDSVIGMQISSLLIDSTFLTFIIYSSFFGLLVVVNVIQSSIML